MGKLYQRVSQLFLALFLMICVYQAYELKNIKYETVVAGDGIVTNKFESDYACGTKGRYTCYSRYLILDDTNKVEVNLDTFKTLQQGDRAYLTYQRKVEQPFYIEVMSFIGLVFLMMSGFILFCFLLVFIYWSILYSSEERFLQFIGVSDE